MVCCDCASCVKIFLSGPLEAALRHSHMLHALWHGWIWCNAAITAHLCLNRKRLRENPSRDARRKSRLANALGRICRVEFDFFTGHFCREQAHPCLLFCGDNQ
jgi:hypothetical protein